MVLGTSFFCCSTLIAHNNNSHSFLFLRFMVYVQHTTVESSPVRPVLHFFLPSQLLLWHPTSSIVPKKKPHTLSFRYHRRTQLNSDGVQLLLSFNTMPRLVVVAVVEIGAVERTNAVSASVKLKHMQQYMERQCIYQYVGIVCLY